MPSEAASLIAGQFPLPYSQFPASLQIISGQALS
jgi:hypothetical protein